MASLHARLAHLFPFTAKSEAETLRFGADVGRLLAAGDVLGLRGDLGAGKTVFVRGVAAGLGLDPLAVTSPTFVIANRYALAETTLHHLDLYRVTSLDELVELGFDEYVGGPEICVVEWSDKSHGLMPPDAVTIHLAHCGQHCRSLHLA